MLLGGLQPPATSIYLVTTLSLYDNEMEISSLQVPFLKG